MQQRTYDVAVVGAGVTGTALLHVLSRYSTVGRIALIESNKSVAEVNSHPLNNAQTSHDGGTETNYSLAHALEVKAAAVALRRFVEAHASVDGLFKKTHRMVLAVGAEEVKELEERFAEFSTFYPDLRLAYADELRRIEPRVMTRRSPDQPVCALVSDQGYAIDYQRLAQCFVHDANQHNSSIDSLFDTSVSEAVWDGSHYTLTMQDGRSIRARVVVFAAGAYSLHFAHKLGYGLDYAILSVAGSFFSGGNQLLGKVYRVQVEGMPFAAIHGDPDVLNQTETRFGPTTKPLPLMVRHRTETFFDFMGMGFLSVRGIVALVRILSRKGLFGYVLKNALYDIPVIGTWLFLKEAQEIVPSLRYRDLHIRKGAGGIRPQIVNLVTGELEMGDKTLSGENCIFNTTPSPGASVCLANAVRDAERVVSFLGGTHQLDTAAIASDLGLAEHVAVAG